MCSLKNETKEKGIKTGKKKRHHLGNGCVGMASVESLHGGWAGHLAGGTMTVPKLFLIYLPTNQSSLQTSCSSSRAARPSFVSHWTIKQQLRHLIARACRLGSLSQRRSTPPATELKDGSSICTREVARRKQSLQLPDLFGRPNSSIFAQG